MEIAPRLRSLGLAGLLHRRPRLRFRLGLGLALGRGCGLFLRGGTRARGLGLRLRRGFGHGVGRDPGRGRSGLHLFLGSARNGLGRHLLHLLRRERLVRGGRGRRDRLVALRHHFALVYPALDADHPVSGLRLRKSVVDVGAQRMKRHAPLAIPLGARDLDAVQAPGAHDLDPLCAQAHGVLHGALHGAAEHDALLQLLRDRVGDELRVDLGLADLLDVHVHHLHPEELAQVRLEHFDVLAFLADDHAGPGAVDRDARVLGRALDHHLADRGVGEPLLQIIADLQVLVQHRCEVPAVRVPARGPVLVDAEPEADWMDFLSHEKSYFLACLAGAFFFSSSPTVTKIWQVRLVMRLPRPLARAWKRLSDIACSTRMVFTLSSSTSAPSLCSALAIADSSTFLMMCAPFFGLKASRLSAFSTGSPRIWSATSRPFWAERRTPYSVARVSMSPPYFFSPPAAGAAGVGAAPGAGAPGAVGAPGAPGPPPPALAAAAASRSFLSAMPWLLKMRVKANSPSLCPTMFSEMYTGTCCFPLWTAMVCPTKSGRIVERRDQVLIGRLSLAARAAPTFFTRWWSTKGPFLTERPMV